MTPKRFVPTRIGPLRTTTAPWHSRQELKEQRSTKEGTHMSPRNSRTIKVQGTVAPKTVVAETMPDRKGGVPPKTSSPAADPAPPKSD